MGRSYSSIEFDSFYEAQKYCEDWRENYNNLTRREGGYKTWSEYKLKEEP